MAKVSRTTMPASAGIGHGIPDLSEESKYTRNCWGLLLE